MHELAVQERDHTFTTTVMMMIPMCMHDLAAAQLTKSAAFIYVMCTTRILVLGDVYNPNPGFGLMEQITVKNFTFQPEWN